MLNADRLQFRFVDVAMERDIAVVTINDPPANTLTHHMVQQLEETFVGLLMAPQVRAVIITGAGDQFFCGGVNIGMLANVSAHHNSDFLLYAGEVFELIEQSELLVVAAVNGHVTGGGLEVALLADHRIAVEGTYNCGFPEVRLGVIPGLGGTQRLSRLVGSDRAFELIADGEFVSPQKAQQLGIFDSVLPRKDFPRGALQATRRLLEQQPPQQLSAQRSTNKPAGAGLVTYQLRERVAVISLSTQCANATPLQVLQELNQAILAARHDETTESLLLTHQADEFTLGEARLFDSATHRYAKYVFKRLTNTPRLCAIAFRGSLGRLSSELAWACDYRLVPQLTPAEQVVLSTFDRGVPGDPRSWRGQTDISFAAAKQRNLLKAIDPAAAWPEAALAWLTRFTSPRGASKCLGYAKLAIRRGTCFPEEAGRMLEWHLQEQLFRRHDAVEGIRAYLEKRAARFNGE